VVTKGLDRLGIDEALHVSPVAFYVVGINTYRTNKMIISANAKYSDTSIETEYEYTRNKVELVKTNDAVFPKVTKDKTLIQFKTDINVPKLGVMIVGWGGSNGTTFTSSVLANRFNVKWVTKEGIQVSNMYGSITQASTVSVGTDAEGNEVYAPFSRILPMFAIENVSIAGWDINKTDLAEASFNAGVFDVDFQRAMKDTLTKVIPRPSIFYPEFVAETMSTRANNLIMSGAVVDGVPTRGTKQQDLDHIQREIQEFKKTVDKVIIMWSASTEKMNDIADEDIVSLIRDNSPRVSASQIFAVASILENCPFINCSAQNTFCKSIVDLAVSRNVFIVGDDLKSGQTKLKTCLVDYLISAGIKPMSIVSYNHLGNEDGKNLVDTKTLNSKEISKGGVIDGMVRSNRILYPGQETPDHTVVIKHVPFVGDSKRAMDEYSSRIFMNGVNTMMIYNVCEDSLLAAPLMMDLIVLTELFTRIKYRIPGSSTAVSSVVPSVSSVVPSVSSVVPSVSSVPSVVPSGTEKTLFNDDEDVAPSSVSSTQVSSTQVSSTSEWKTFHPVLSSLGYLMKSPLTTRGPQVNSLFRQRQGLVNILFACAGLNPSNDMILENRL
jgi:myo-inositol-1-phosphate synthase